MGYKVPQCLLNAVLLLTGPMLLLFFINTLICASCSSLNITVPTGAPKAAQDQLIHNVLSYHMGTRCNASADTYSNNAASCICT